MRQKQIFRTSHYQYMEYSYMVNGYIVFLLSKTIQNQKIQKTVGVCILATDYNSIHSENTQDIWCFSSNES